jgi:hypothetical protein
MVSHTDCVDTHPQSEAILVANNRIFASSRAPSYPGRETAGSRVKPLPLMPGYLSQSSVIETIGPIAPSRISIVWREYHDRNLAVLPLARTI